MKKLFVFLMGTFLFFNAFSQGTANIKGTEDYSKWLFIQGDKALQYRFKLIKEEGDTGYYQVQFRTEFEDSIFCKHPTCLGYLLVFGYPAPDNQTNIETSYAFYNTFKDVYTRPDLVPLKLSFPDGSKRFLTPDGFNYTLAGSTEAQPATYLFGNCVDDILEGKPDYHRCKPYQPAFKSSEAIVIK